jgi:Restriction endonuclease NotI
MLPKLHPLAEVFGFPVDNQSAKAVAARKNQLCPYNNKVPNCTKDKAKNPLGVCSVFHDGAPAITCPVRFREDWIITSDAAGFFFGENVSWSSLTEVRLTDGYGKSAGNIDVVLVAYDAQEKIIDFGALEVQAVYISGNVREPFEYFMADPKKRHDMDWTAQPNYPRPDYLSSSRKRLAPQLMFKGGILNAWGKKSAVALSKAFFNTLPELKRVPKKDADVAWFVYDLVLNLQSQRYELTKVDEVFTRFDEALQRITTTKAGPLHKFIDQLQNKLDEQLETAPSNKTIENPF